MGWQDAPEVIETQSKWQSAPEEPVQPSQGVSGTRPGDYTIGGQPTSLAERWQKVGVPPEVAMETGLPMAEQRTLPGQEQITSPLQIPGAVARQAPGVAVGVPTAAAALATGGASLPIQAAIPGAVAAGSEALRQYAAGEPQQPGRTWTTGALTALMGLLGPAAKYLGSKMAQGTAGFPEAMQETIRPEVETMAASLPAPSSKPLRGKLDSYWAAKEAGDFTEQLATFPEAATAENPIHGFPEFIDMTRTGAAAKELSSTLKPVIEELNKNKTTQQYADAIQKLLESHPAMTPQKLDQILKEMRQVVKRAAPTDEARRAAQIIYDAARQDLAASAELPGHHQSAMLQQARQMEAREAAVGQLQASLTRPGAPAEEIPQVVKEIPQVGKSGLLRTYSPKQLLSEMNEPTSHTATWLRGQLTPDEYTALQRSLSEWAQYPTAGPGGRISFEERIIPYLLMGGAGGALGYHRGGRGGAVLGGMAGIGGAYYGGQMLRDLAQTPMGREVLRSMFLAGRTGAGPGTMALQATAPALAELLQGGGR